MRPKHKGVLFATMVAATAILAQGCASQSSSDESGIRFPDIDSSYIEEGVFIAPRDVLLVSQGQSKDQVRRLLDNPHFTEGVFSPKKWNYIFNFHTDRVEKGYISCQYQIEFDDNTLVDGTYWKNPICADLLIPVEVDQIPESGEEKVTLSSDVLFDFDSDVLRLEGQRSLVRVADILQAEFSDPDVRVVGHTDRIGDDAYNQVLSENRAQSVRYELVNNGIDPARIRALGVGESQPVVSCADRNGEQLKTCLQPNRRVDILINGERKTTSD